MKTPKKSSKSLKPTKKKLRSGLEDRIRSQLEKANKEYEYETHKLQYTVPESVHTYIPDFVIFKSSGEPILIECKGRWEFQDRYKHRLLFEQHPQLDLRFVFGRASNKLSKGSSQTYGTLCSGHGRGVWRNFRRQYADGGVIPESWLLE